MCKVTYHEAIWQAATLLWMDYKIREGYQDTVAVDVCACMCVFTDHLNKILKKCIMDLCLC